MKIKITDLQRFSTMDGPGIRTLVYFAGCGMRCQWCHNPETQKNYNRLLVDASKCIGCMRCTQVCGSFACYRNENGAFVTDWDRCIGCMECVKVCYAEARRCTIREMTAEELTEEIKKDAVFYRTSGGGATLSGGEAVLQTEGCTALLRQLKAAGIHTALETAGYYSPDMLEAVLPYIDLFLFDLKMMDSEKHKFYTGAENGQILKNFVQAAKQTETILRVALIPGVNDGEEFKKIVQFVKENTSVRELHILPFHQLGDSKYEQLGEHYEMYGRETENEKNIATCYAYAKEQGFYVNIGGSGKKKEGMEV